MARTFAPGPISSWTWGTGVRVAPGAGRDDGPGYAALRGGDDAVLTSGGSASWREVRLRQVGGDVPGVAGRRIATVDFRASRGGGADEPRRRAGAASQGDRPQ